MNVYVFQGQGAQKKGMGEGLFEEFKELTRKADEILGYSIKELCLDDADGRLPQTRFSQPAVYVVNALTYFKKIRTDPKPDVVLGHSVGEYNALLASGVFDFQQGLKLVKKRGELLSTVNGGGMAAVMGLSENQVEEILKKDHVNNLYIANYNSPYQVVIAGLKKEIEQAESLFLDNGAAHYQPLNVNSASHTPFMADVKKKFKNYIKRFQFGEINTPIIANFTARPYKQAEIGHNMSEQLTSPVRWTESIRYLLARGFDIDDFYEIGTAGASVVKALAVRTNNEAGPLDPGILEREEKEKGNRSGKELPGHRSLDISAGEFRREKYFPDLEAIILSLFNRKPYGRQPKYIAHTGCGDGTLLKKINDTIKNKSLRAGVLDEYPVRLIGIDWNEKALADTARTLKHIDHLVLKGDINDPAAVITNLKKMGVRDPENILHVHSSPDHGRSAVPPPDMSSETARAGIPAETAGPVTQHLTGHFKRWSSVIGGHGLVILGLHCLEPNIVGQFIHQRKHWRDDSRHCLSQGLSVEADRFLMAAAGAGLFPDPEFSGKYPKTLPFTRVTLNRFQRREYRVRFAQEKDLPVLAQLEKQCWEPALRISAPVIKRRLKRCPRGQLVLEMSDHNNVVGVIYSQRAASPEEVKNTAYRMLERLHQKEGPVVQLLSINILPEMQYLNLGDQLLEFMLQRCTLMNGIRTIAGVTRFKDYYKHPGITPQEYMNLRDAQARPVDPTLRFHQLHGVQVKGLVPNYRPQDKKNKGYGVFIQYDPFHRQRREIHIETAETTPTVKSITDFIVKTIISILGKTGESGFSPRRPLMEMGLDSAHILELSEKIRYQYQIRLEPGFFFKYHTADRIISYLQEHMDLVEKEVVTGGQKTTAAAGEQIHGDKDIAVIGAACRLPGGIRGKEQLWELLIKGQDAVRKLPGQRWNWPADIDPDNEHKGIDRGGFLDDIAAFDAPFFRISPREAELMDPQQRILLELSWECLEDAGYPAKALAGSKTGVFIGASGSDYHILLDRHLKEVDAQLGIGTSMAALPNRISYFYDFRGPSLQIDTACSASLAAVHEAIQSIQAGKCRTALVGGVHIMCHSANSIAYYKAGMLSKNGKCKTFDKEADGYVRAEGAIMLLLKPLSRALGNGDTIYAVIKGSSINHGGQAGGLTVPNPGQQAALLIDAYQTAGVEPETVGYIEAHGTGTPLGDPIEISGLKEAFSRLAKTKKTAQKPFCGLGSIKTNIGHLEAAAGMAGLLKAVLALRHQTLPASLNFNELNPHMTLTGTPFYIVDKNQPWPLPEGGSLRRAGVSSFGSGGTNVHLVLEQAPVNDLPSATRGRFLEKLPPGPPQKRLINSIDPGLRRTIMNDCYLICLSAKSEKALRQKQQDMLTWLEKQGKQHHLVDICAALLLGREHFDCRAALVVKSKQELQEKLKEVLEKGDTRDYFKENHTGKRQPRRPPRPGKKTSRREHDNKLMALAELYAGGYDREWQARYGDNRAPRINLPSYPFAGERYWIPGTGIDTPLPAPSPTRADEPGQDELMLLPRWEEQAPATPGKHHGPHTVLMVYAGFANRLVKTILDHYRQNQATKKIIQVRLGHQTGQISKDERQEEWECDINDPGGFAACLHRYDSIARLYFIPGCREENQPVDFDAVADSQQENEIQLLRLVKFLQNSDKTGGSMDCFIITRDNYPIGDTPVNPYGGGISGLVFAAAQRDHRFLLRNIDISTRDLVTPQKRGALLRLILDERPTERGEVIKLDNGSRYKRVFLKPAGNRFADGPGLKKQGVYVILGGSGAVGGIITRYLIREYRAKVAWIGRKPETSPLIQEKIAALRDYGEPPLYIQADALCREQMKQAVADIKRHYSTIDGAIFSGVVYNFANSINQTTEREFLDVFNVKTKGSINFYAALREESLDFMCYFSSVHAFSFTGSAGFAAYTSGITFTDKFVHFIGKTSRFPVGIINWGLWKSSLGESIDGKIINKKSGLLGDREGFACFEHFTRLLRRGVLNQVLCLRASQPVRQLMNSKEEEPVPQLTEQVAVPAPGPSAEDMEEYIKAIILDHLARSLKISKTGINCEVAFSDYGVDSIIGAGFVKQLNGALDINMKTAVLFDYTTVNRLSCCILETYRQQIQNQLAATTGHRSPQTITKPNARGAIKSFDQTFSKVWPPAGPPEAINIPGIAVIGMAGQFPGARDIDTFWQNLVRGHDAVREFPPQYLNQSRRPGGKKQAGNTVYKWGGILENRDCFDPLFFNISPREAESMNPHQRLILQESWKALEDAGYNPRDLSGTRAGMFIGAEPTGYDFESFTGYSDAIIASRLSYYLNLHGPAMVVNTGCSSSGAALHLACQSLRHGESSLALAGGVFAMLEQPLLDRLAKLGMLSPAGRCRAFDESADGMVFSEGVGVVALKRLDDAVAAGDHIYGVIIASGMNQDGASNGITAPNGLAQEQLITGVYQQYGINPEEITYIEANGTGTKLGDTVEANSLVRAFKRFTPGKHYCALGSADTHIGHTAAATGVIGLIKILLSLRHHQLPGLLHFKTLNPLIQFDESAFYVNTGPSGWTSKNGKPLTAALNSFGHSGTNVHLVVREYLPPGEMALLPAVPTIVNENTPVLIPLSAKNKGRLHEYALKLLDFLTRSSPGKAGSSIGREDSREDTAAALAYTLQTGREAMEERVVFLVRDIPALITELEAFTRGGEETGNCWSGSSGPGKDIAALLYSDEELSHAIKKWMSKGKLRKIAQLWARGFAVNWELLYGETRPRRISLPTYPFAGERYWIPTGETENEPGPPALTPVLSKTSPSPGKELAVNPGESPPGNTRDYLLRFFSLELKLAPDRIQLNKDPRTYGADSITFMKLIRRIEKDFHTGMTVKEILEHPTIQSLSTHLARKIGNPDHQGSKPAVNIEPGTIPPLKNPLSEGQKGLWMLQKMVPGMSAYNVPLCFRIGRGLNIETFKRACGFLLRQYPILTTVITEEQGIPFQVQRPLQPLAFQQEDISTPASAEIPAHLKKKAGEPFSWERGGLMRIHLLSRSEQEHFLLICIHHIIFDGLSLLPFITTLLNTYRDLVGGKNPVPTPCSTGYGDFVRWEREMLKSREGEQHLSYWKQQLSGPLPVLELPGDYPRGSCRSFQGQTHTHMLSSGLSQQVKSFAQSRQVSPAMVFLGIFKVLLHRYTGQEEIIVGMPAMGRPQERFESLIGYFVNMIPVRSQGINGQSFAALLRELQLTAAEGLDHAVYPFPALVRELNLPRTPGTPPVFQVAFAYQNFLQSKPLQHFLDQYQHILPLEFMEEINQEGEYEIELEVFAREEGFLLKIKFNPGLFAAATITRMMGHYVEITGEILRDPGLTPARYSLLSAEEQKTILVDWNSNRADYPTNQCIHELFDRQARETPHAIAVVNEGQCLSYRELAGKSTGTAIHLQSRGVGPDDPVGICTERSLEMIIGILGILKAGGAYLPIDPDYPEERKKYMLKDSGAGILLTGQEIADLYSPQYSPRTFNNSPKGAPIHPSNLAYIIYTSGSTGKPKGTAVPHRAPVNFIYSMSANYDNDFSPKDNCLSSTNFCFDVSVCEIFMNLVWGASVVIFPREKAFDPGELAKAIVKHAITFAYLPPGLLRDVFKNLEPYRDRLNLNKMLVGVEPIKDHVLEDYLTLNPSMRIVNGYGPTEATICATAYRYRSREPADKQVPIGTPLANNTVVLLDNYNCPVPVGVPGELCIAGHGLAKGYINKPGLTAGRFCLRRPGGLFSRKLPPWTPRKSFSSGTGGPVSIYCSGDLARWLPDGNLEFIGRLDTQVKIRGFRIELNEIENQLNTHPGIKESVVVVKEQENNKQLIAFYVPQNPGHQKEPLDPQQLRGHLKTNLPGYMIPAAFMRLESIPLTPNGKVDRKKLREQNVIFTRNKKALPPRSETEENVLNIWKDLLHREDIGIEDGFFDVGGDSILAVTAAERIKKNLECDFNVTTLFKYSNIKEISKYITGTKAGVPVSHEEPGKKPAAGSAIHAGIHDIETHGGSPYPHYPGYYQDSFAIIGISCHFPGAKNHHEFWNNLREGKESTRFFSRDELQDLGIPAEIIQNPNYIPVQYTIEGKELFDPGFFNISPRDAEFMDPQLRLLLLQSWQAIEDAGYNCKQIPQTSVYMSASNSFYQALLPGAASRTTGIIEHPRQYVSRVFAQGGTIPTMISHQLGLKGPSFFVHTNCSSSLAGIHLACRGLKSGEAAVALVGAATVTPSSNPGYVHQPGLNFSSNGHIKAFDAAADGMTGGEGAAVIVLKKALDAIKDGDHIYALIRGTAVNNDGPDKVGFYAPSINGQAGVIRDVLDSTRIHPGTIGYIETHGTGTKLGDPIEFAALAEVYRQYTEKKQFCGIGSVKTNIGHLDTAAGLAGCIKVALSLYHNEIPPSLNFKKPNPGIDMKNSPFYVVERLEKWEKSPVPHRAALSSFGIGGTNTHAILEQYVAAGTARHVLPGASHPGRSYIIPLSAKNGGRLKVYAQKLLEFLNHSVINLEALAYTLQTGREAMEERVVFLAGDITALKTKLKAFAQGKEKPDDCRRGKVKQDKDMRRLFANDEELNQAIETWISRGKPGKIAELWVQGFAVKWELLYGETRPQRISLPTYPFAGEPYWVPGPCVPDQGAGPGTKGDYELMTFAEDWQEQALPGISSKEIKTPKEIKTLVCFLSEPQHQQAVVETIKTLHHDTRVVFIARHPTYRKHGPKKYGIPAAEGHAYREAFKSICRDYGRVEALLYLWPLEDAGFIRDYCPIVYILQAMAPVKNPAPRRLNKNPGQTSANGCQPAGPPLKPGRLLLAGQFANAADQCYLESWIGFERSMGLVLPNTRVAAVIQDKTAGRQDREAEIKDWTRVLWAELQTPECRSVMYRGGKRHVCRVRPTTIQPGKTLLKPGATYLITGGCGGLGFLFARHIAGTYRGNLVLTGRSPLDEKKKSQIKILEEAGGRVLYVQADVCNPDRMKEGMKRAGERFGSIHGVIHAAGILDETGILEKDAQNFQNVLDPKINGTLVLDEVLHENREPLDFTCYFSSSSAILGDFGACDYAVGNRFQMAYAHYREHGKHRARPRDKTVVINWPLWKDGGKGFKSEENRRIYLKSSGQRFLEAREGVELFERLLSQSNTRHLVLVGQPRRVHRFLGLGRRQNPASLSVVHGPAGQGRPVEMKGASLHQCLESDLKEHIGRLLKISRDRLDIDKNLADFGFDSIGFVEFATLLNNHFNVEITPGIFFQEPTIGALTRYFLKEHEEALRRYYQEDVPGHIPPGPAALGQQASPGEPEKPGGIPGSGPAHRYPELVHLNRVTQGRPVFWIHAGMGGVEVYQALAKTIQRPFYGIQARGWMTGRVPLNGIRAMAAYYFHIIESLQPEGPYDLGGYSLGGVLAYEVARRLQEMGHTVETLVMLEPPDSTHLRKISPLKKGDMLRAVNMALLMTIRQEPGKITQTLVHRDEVNLDVPEEVFLRRLITLAKPRGLANTDAQLRAFIRQCAKVQGAYEYGNYVEHPLPDPQGVTAYYFLKTGEAFYGELKPYFTVRDDEMPLDHTNFWQGWRELLPRLHMLEVNAPNHLMLLTEPEAYETISRFCRALYSGKGAPPAFLESFKSKSKKVNEKKRTDEVYTMSNTSTVFMFPGQGAQRKGMGEGLFDEFKELTRKADKILGYSIKELCLEDNDGRLVQTRFTQPAVYVVNALSYLKRNRTGSGPGYVLGHSVGEYNALFASGVIDFESGLRLVKKRGELMSQATGGGMAAVMGLSEDKVGEILEQNNLDNLYIANYNSPRQIVISGLKKDIEQAESLFLDLGAAHYRVLNVGGAFHTPYMADAKEKFKDFVNEFDFGRITIPIIANVTARPYKQEEIRDNMIEQITGPVRWTESIRWLLARGVDIDDMDEIGMKGLSVVKALAIRTNNEGVTMGSGKLLN